MPIVHLPLTFKEILQVEELEARAYEFAKLKHAGQDYGGQPFEYHLFQVVGVLKRFGIYDPDLLASGWLHDSIEDTDTTYDVLVAAFGEPVAKLVWAVTDSEGKNRKERKASMYPKVRATPKAILLKLADRIANVEEGIKTRAKIRFMYLKEHDQFMEELFSGRLALLQDTDPRARKMWAHLIDLMQRIKEE